MIGLEFICKLYDKQFKDLAEELGVSKQVVNGWIKEKYRISQKHLPKLVKIFKIPEEYFQKQVDDIDKLKIQYMKLDNDYVEIEDIYIERDTGKEIILTYENPSEERYRQQLLHEIKVKELQKKLKETIDDTLKSEDENVYIEQLQYKSENVINVINKFFDIICEEKIDTNTMERILAGIRMYKGENELDDKLSRDICTALKVNHQNEITDFLRDEDLLRELRYGNVIDKVKNENNIKEGYVTKL